MDPNEALLEQRELIAWLLSDTAKHKDRAEYVQKAERLAEVSQALDTWLAKGGFLPDRWHPNLRKRA